MTDLEGLKSAAEKAKADGDWEIGALDAFRLRTPDGAISISWQSSDGSLELRAEAVAAYLVAAQPATILELLSERSALVERVRQLEFERDAALHTSRLSEAGELEAVEDLNTLRDRALERTIAAQAAETALSALRREVGEVLGPFVPWSFPSSRYENHELLPRHLLREVTVGQTREAHEFLRRAAQLHASVQEGNQGSSSVPSPTTSGARADRGELAPGHTDLMVSPESISAWLQENPPPVEGEK
jgi:hypothetical protein